MVKADKAETPNVITGAFHFLNPPRHLRCGIVFCRCTSARFPDPCAKTLRALGQLPKLLRLKFQFRGGTAFYFDETVLLILLLSYWAGGGKNRGLGLFAALLFLVVVHEMAHWLVGRCQGFRCRVVRMGLWDGYCYGAWPPHTRTSPGHLLFAIAGVLAEFIALAVALALHYFTLWPTGDFYAGIYRGFTVWNFLLICLNLYPHDGSDGEEALATIGHLRSQPKR